MTKIIGTFSSYNILSLTKGDEGDIAYVKDFKTEEQTQYIFSHNKWEKMDNVESSKGGIPLIAINEMIVRQKGKLSKAELKDRKEMLNDFFKTNPSDYYMLLIKPNYYTIFKHNEYLIPKPDYLSLGEGVIDCLQNAGTIYEIGEDNGKIEIWVRFPKNEEVSVGYLFPYAEGVVTFYG